MKKKFLFYFYFILIVTFIFLGVIYVFCLKKNTVSSQISDLEKLLYATNSESSYDQLTKTYKNNQIEVHISDDMFTNNFQNITNNSNPVSFIVTDDAGDKFLYVAKKWKNNQILYLSKNLVSINYFMLTIVFLFYIVFINVIISFLSKKYILAFLTPFNNVLNNIKQYVENDIVDVNYNDCETIKDEKIYKEINPLTIKFNNLLEQLKIETDKIKFRSYRIENTLNSMEEGLIMLDIDFNILLMNSQSKKFLNIKKMDTKITLLYRHLKFRESLEKLKETNESQKIDIPKNKLILRFSMSKSIINPKNTSETSDEAFVVLISDVTELIRLEKMRSQFTSNVTHELKTPLTSIRGFAELISMGMVKDQKQIMDFNDKIFFESKRMINLVDDILKLSDIENGDSPIPEVFFVKEIFIYAFEILKNALEEKRITYSISGNFKMKANKNKIYEVVLNLITNAVKYNNVDGKIIINIYEDKYSCWFTVEDTGIGIANKEKFRIFERFYCVDKARSRKAGGTGLGLSIVKHIVEIYNGSVTVKSGEHGSTFIVSFPIDIKAD